MTKKIIKRARKIKNFKLIYVLAFIIAISDALTGYIQSSFLNQYLSLSCIGLVIATGAIITLLIAIFYHKLIIRFTNYRLTLLLFLLAALSSFMLYFSESMAIIMTAFVIRYVCLMFIATSLDIFLENISDDKNTGLIRTKFLTITNLAWLVSPILMSLIIGMNNNYQNIYLTSSILLLVTLLIIAFKQKDLDQPANYKKHNIRKALQAMWQNRNILMVWRSSVLLNFFYFIVSIYVPIHLHLTIGLTWQSLGIIFTVMLLPFVLFQIPAGIIADKYLGEKEMLMAGHFIMALSMCLIFFITTNNLIAWGAVLFLSRIGAALAEAMQETYFYKQVSIKDVDLINLFRRSRSLGWLLGATVAFILLPFISLPHIFMILSTALLINAFSLHHLVDTK